MGVISDGDLLVLILLAQGATHGYQIEQILRQSHARQWVQIGTSSVYASLERLAKKGYVTDTIDASVLPARRAFSITETGRTSMVEQAQILLARGESVYLGVNLGLAAYPFLDHKVVAAALRERRSKIDALLTEALTFQDSAGDSSHPHQRWIREHTIHMLKAELMWMDNMVMEIENDIEDMEG